MQIYEYFLIYQVKWLRKFRSTLYIGVKKA